MCVFPCQRVFVLVLVVVSVLWIPLVQASQGGQLFIYIQSISMYLQPPITVIFLAGCFWKRTNEKVQAFRCFFSSFLMFSLDFEKYSLVMYVNSHLYHGLNYK